MHTVMMTCCVIHNMIVEDESSSSAEERYMFDGEVSNAPGHFVTSARSIYETLKVLESSQTHYCCRDDLIDFLSNFQGELEE